MHSRKLLSPLSDLVFKALFGREKKESKLILIDFLNAILHLQGQAKIEKITHLNPFNLQNFEGDKASVLDLKVKTEEGKRINIEVQVNKEDDFRKRSLFYWANMYTETIAESEAYLSLKKCIVINLLDFEIITETTKYHTEYHILEKAERFRLIDDLEMHYLELPKFDPKKDTGQMQAHEQWLTFMKNADKPEMEEKMNKLIERSEAIKMAKKMLNEISADELMRQKYYAREKARLDEISRIKYAEIKGMERGMEKGLEQGLEKGMEKGLEKGMEKGMEKGIEKGKLEGLKEAAEKTAKKLLLRGFSPEQVVDLAELTLEEVMKLKETCED